MESEFTLCCYSPFARVNVLGPSASVGMTLFSAGRLFGDEPVATSQIVTPLNDLRFGCKADADGFVLGKALGGDLHGFGVGVY